MRNAWKTRFAGWPARCTAAGVAAWISRRAGLRSRSGWSSRCCTMRAGVARRQLLLAVLVEDAAQLALAVVGEDVGCGQLGGAVHAHVERRILRVGEAALARSSCSDETPRSNRMPATAANPELVEHLARCRRRRCARGGPGRRTARAAPRDCGGRPGRDRVPRTRVRGNARGRPRRGRPCRGWRRRAPRRARSRAGASSSTVRSRSTGVWMRFAVMGSGVGPSGLIPIRSDLAPGK